MPGALQKTALLKLFNELQLFNDIVGTAQFINAPQHIADVYIDSTVEVFIESQFVAERFVVAVESQTDQLAISVDRRRA